MLFLKKNNVKISLIHRYATFFHYILLLLSKYVFYAVCDLCLFDLVLSVHNIQLRSCHEDKLSQPLFPSKLNLSGKPVLNQ